MQRLAWLTLIFTILFAVFIVGPALLNQPFPAYPLMKLGDVLDVFTPLALMPAYWLLFRIDRDRTPSHNQVVAFLVLAALWVEGQGMHLAANSIGHLTKALPGSEVDTLARFYDEVLSHYLWHLGLVGLSALAIYRQWRSPFAGQRSGLGVEIVAGSLHGFNYFITVVEAATAPLGVPFAAGVVVFTLVWGRGRLRQQPVLAFFFVAYAVATLFFLGWGLYWGGLPEFSQVGIIE